MTRLERWLTTVLVMCGMAAEPPLAAQQTPPAGQPTRVPVTLALGDALPNGAPFRIIRRAGATPGDVIVVAVAGNADDLSDAVHELLLMRQIQGDTALTTGAMRIRRQPRGPQQVQRYPWTARVLNDLRNAPRKTVAGVGSVPAVEIWLPPQRGRAPAR